MAADNTEYAALHIAAYYTWCVIEHDTKVDPEKWTVYILDAGSENTAREMAISLNQRDRGNQEESSPP